MSANTSIEWCDHTFNPWVGCTKISPACDHCYAEGWAKRSGMVQWGPHAERRRTSAKNWRAPIKWNAAHDAFFAEHGRRQRVFCASLADVFDNQVESAWRDDLFQLIAMTPNLDWLLLTKRIGNVGNMLPVPFDFDRLYPNVWLGATICDQAEADRDIPKLLAVPAAKRFLSMEPLLGPVNLTNIAPPTVEGRVWHGIDALTPANHPLRGCIDWVIVGGESGPGARPMHPDWARSLRDQCQAAGVLFLFKQWGEWLPINQQDEAFTNRLYRSNRKAALHQDQGNLDDIYGRTCTVPYGVVHIDGSSHEPLEPMAFLQGTGAMTTFKVGKKAAGRHLDGREWNEVPSNG